MGPYHHLSSKSEFDEVKTLTWSDVKILSTEIDGKEVRYANKVLDELMKDKVPKKTATAFRPGLATILAQRGASPDEMKSLGTGPARHMRFISTKGAPTIGGGLELNC